MKHLMLAASALACAAPSRAQVVITEVHPAEGWIEIQNRGTAHELMDSSSVLCTTATPGQPNEYWWAFPTGASIAPGAFVRIHWFAPARPATADEIWTGTAATDFLFGLGGEALDPTVGSVALLGTQQGAYMGTSAYYEDWITWGQTARPREAYAVHGGLWIHGTAVPAPGAGESIALADDPAAEPTPVSAFFLDSTPSPLAPNQVGARLEHYGTDCAVGVANAPSMSAVGVPAIGNPAFRLRVIGTNALLGQSVIVLIGLGRGVGAIVPVPQFTCPLWVEGGGIAPLVVVLPATPGQTHTDLPISLATAGPEVAGVTLYVQAITGRIPLSAFDHAASGGLAVTIGS